MDYIQLKRATLLGKLTALLDLETLNAPPRMALWPGVLPVLDVRELLCSTKAANVLFDITATGWTGVPGAVPVGKIWRMASFGLVLASGGFMSFDSFRLKAPLGNYVVIDTFTAGSSRQTWFGGQTIDLPEGWTFEVNAGVVTATGHMRAELLYKEFDAY